jgi:hypothetical protein
MFTTENTENAEIYFFILSGDDDGIKETSRAGVTNLTFCAAGG